MKFVYFIFLNCIKYIFFMNKTYKLNIFRRLDFTFSAPELTLNHYSIWIHLHFSVDVRFKKAGYLEI